MMAVSAGLLVSMLCLWTCYKNVMLAGQHGQVVAFFQDSCTTAVPNPCQQVCTDIQSGGFYCQCQTGFIINDDGMTCSESKKDIENTVLPDQENTVLPDQENTILPDQQGDLPPSADLTKEMPVSEGIFADKAGSSDIHIESVDLKKGLPSLQTDSYTRRLKTERGVVLDQYFYNIPERASSDHYASSFFNNMDIPEGGDHSSYPTNQNGLLSSEGDKLGHFDGESSCDRVICENNGTCAVMGSRAVCQCLLGTFGKHCERVIEVRYPRFEGTGYLGLPLQSKAHKQFRLSLQFKPESPNGLMLMSGGAASANSDFFSVVLEDGFIIYRFGCGSRTVVLRTSSRVTLAAWNKLVITRSNTRGTVQLNTEHQVEGQYQTECSRLPFHHSLYLGGFSDMREISGLMATSDRYVGCVQELAFTGRKFDFRRKGTVRESTFGVNVGECSEHVCDGVICLNNGTCTVRSADESTCLCPLGFHGETCQNDSPVRIPYFSGHSYLVYPGLERSVLSYTEIEIVFKPVSPDGTLFYNGYSSDGSGDFISLSLSDGHLEFRFDLGTGPAVIRSFEALTMNVWHLVQASRTGLMGILSVDGQLQSTGHSRGAYTQLTLLDGLYLGGHPSYDQTSRHANTTSSFTGCLQKVAVNGKIINLMSGAVTGVSIAPCPHPCEGEPCMNGGQCKPHLDTYKCSCPLGYGNSNCEEAQQHLPNRPMFRGASYLMYKDKEITKRVAGSRMDLQMYIRPRGHDGLLFWSGEDQIGKSIRDFISLGFHGGSLQLRYNLGSGEALIGFNDSRMFDGRWHFIRVQRDKQDAYMEIDKKEIVEGSSPGGYTSLNTNKLVYLGGMPNIAEKTGGRYTTGFVGCVRNLRLATEYDVKLLAQAHSGRNVDQCRKKIFT